MKVICKLCIYTMLLMCGAVVNAQKFKSVSSYIHFFSDAPMEDIEAENKDGQSAINLATGEIVFSVPISSFIFEKSLMQEHFNENYMESDKYPKASFKGVIHGIETEALEWQQVKAKGQMNIHGMDNEGDYDGKIKIKGDSAFIETKFPIRLADYKIKIPKVVFYNIAEVVDVTVKFRYAKIN